MPFGAPSQEIPMTPDESVVWKLEVVEKLGGYIVAAADTPSDFLRYFQKVIDFISDMPYPELPNEIGMGGSGYAYHWPTTESVLKVNPHSMPQPLGLTDLQANVTLEAGLRRTQAEVQGPVTYAAPSYVAGFIAHSPRGRDVGSAYMMTAEAGVTLKNLDDEIAALVPGIESRIEVYNAALEACGGASEAYELDMNPGNELYALADDPVGSAGLTVVKLDIMTARPKKW